MISALPRTRGDGPPRSRCSPWTQALPRTAGMDLAIRHASTGAARALPRTRGDGPAAQPVRRRRQLSPARAGMDPTRAVAISSVMLSPARAGMDLHAPTADTRQPLPRTRGDGPGMDPVAELRPGRSPPHARGWTRDDSGGSVHPVGLSPARAGMDPVHSRRRRPRPLSPARAGMDPSASVHLSQCWRSPPHTRGWTLVKWFVGVELRALPRTRGDGPARGYTQAGEALPRTRGDGPRMTVPDAEIPMLSPHTRGWTRHLETATRPSALPRTRGDGPVERTGRVCRCTLPAHAGMDPWIWEGVMTIHGSPPHARGWTLPGFASEPASALPRTRGDGPASSIQLHRRSCSPPHTRGWTLQPPVCYADDELAPPHTRGWTSIRDRRDHARRLPRTRGDGPDMRPRRHLRAAAPPHMRGWTYLYWRTGRTSA